MTQRPHWSSRSQQQNYKDFLPLRPPLRSLVYVWALEPDSCCLEWCLTLPSQPHALVHLLLTGVFTSSPTPTHPLVVLGKVVLCFSRGHPASRVSVAFDPVLQPEAVFAGGVVKVLVLIRHLACIGGHLAQLSRPEPYKCVLSGETRCIQALVDSCGGRLKKQFP